MAKRKSHELYHCLTVENDLKAGKAVAIVSQSEDGLIEMDLVWEWLDDGARKGVSKYREISRNTAL